MSILLQLGLGIMVAVSLLLLFGSLKLDPLYYKRAYSRKLQSYAERRQEILRRKKEEAAERQKERARLKEQG